VAEYPGNKLTDADCEPIVAPLAEVRYPLKVYTGAYRAVTE
jgi:hypothetical protein